MSWTPHKPEVTLATEIKEAVEKAVPEVVAAAVSTLKDINAAKKADESPFFAGVKRVQFGGECLACKAFHNDPLPKECSVCRRSFVETSS